MKKVLLLVCFSVILNSFKTEAQIFSPGYRGTQTVGIIYYPTGYYQGQIYDGYANGLGYFVFADGSIYYGMYSQGWCNGQGVFISRYYGYVTGCWNMGNYVGPCFGGNPYEDPGSVQKVIENVAQNQPQQSNEKEIPEVDPDGYKIVPIDPNTPLGGKVLKGNRNP